MHDGMQTVRAEVKGEPMHPCLSSTQGDEKDMRRVSLSLCSAVVAMTIHGTSLHAQSKPIAPVSQMKDIEQLVDRYFISLNESDDKRRRELIKQVWAEKGRFGVVPLVVGDGIAAIDE